MAFFSVLKTSLAVVLLSMTVDGQSTQDKINGELFRTTDSKMCR